MTNIKDLFEEHIKGGEVYRPPMKLELVRGERIWYVSFDVDLEDKDKLRELRAFELRTDKLPFNEGLDLLLKLNSNTYQARVNLGLGHKDLTAEKAKKFCKRYYAMHKDSPEDITVVTPKNTLLHLRAHNQPGKNRYVLVDQIKGNIERVRSHINKVDDLITDYFIDSNLFDDGCVSEG